MMTRQKRKIEPGPKTYQISVGGRISSQWLNWFDATSIAAEEGDDGAVLTTIHAELLDQAALLGLLQKLYSLGLTIYELRQLVDEPIPADATTPTSDDSPKHESAEVNVRRDLNLKGDE